MENLELINFTDKLLAGNELNINTLKKATRLMESYFKAESLKDFKNELFSNNTFKIYIKYHINQHRKLGKESNYFELEGVENMVNIVNRYHFQNVGIESITIYGENKKKIKTSNYKGNYQETIPVKGLLFKEIF